MQRKLLAMGMLLGLAVALAACAAEEEAKPAAPAPAPAAPEAKPAWEQEWERVVAAAKQEGKVVLAGQAATVRRRALTEPFEQKYGITVEYMANGNTLAQRIKTERAAGQYLFDVFISGGNTMDRVLRPIGALEPLEPALILPEVKDPKKWLGGALPYFDDEQRYIMNFFAAKSPPIMVNSNIVKPEEFKSYKELLNPKWKGKIVADDPRVPGPGQAKWRFYAAHADLGPDFIRALLKQEITFTRSEDQHLKWLIAGRYPVCIGCGETLGRVMRDQGLPIRFVTELKEGIDITTGWGGVVLLNRAPHPNAAKVYINWLLSQEGQTELLTRMVQYASLRLDVPTTKLEPYQIPKETDRLMNTNQHQRQAQTTIEGIFKELLRD